MDLGSLIVAALLSLGLIGTDAVLNAGTINFDIQVTEDLTKRGFTPQLVDAMMDNDLKSLIDFRSIVHPPQIRSSQEKSVVGAVADSLNLKEVTTSFQSDFGLNPVRLSGSLMQSGKDGLQFRFILAGGSRHTGEFTIDEISGDRSLPVFLEDMAMLVVARLEPYAAAISSFKLLSRRLINHTLQPGPAGKTEHDAFIAFIEKLTSSESGQEDSEVDHAAFHNLIGIVGLMMRESAQARESFKTAMILDPSLGIPAINLALCDVTERRFDDAIAVADEAMKVRAVRSVPYVLSTAITVRALAQWGKGDLQAASDSFLNAVKAYPGTLWGYFYWSELLKSAGNAKGAELLSQRAQENMNSAETYPEVAFMHIRIRTDAAFALQPIDLSGIRHPADIYAQN